MSKKSSRIRKSLIQLLATPVDPKDLLYAIEVFQMAASGRYPMDRAPSDLKVLSEDSVYAFADIPLNRGMIAVTREFRHKTDGERQAIAWRVTEFGTFCTSHRADLERLGLLRETDDGWEVSEAVHHAAALCPFKFQGKGKNERVRFDAAVFLEIAVAEHARDEAAK